MPNPVDDISAGWMLTWVFQVMPLFFVCGGVANRSSYDGTGIRWVRPRVLGLLVPAAAYAGGVSPTRLPLARRHAARSWSAHRRHRSRAPDRPQQPRALSGCDGGDRRIVDVQPVPDHGDGAGAGAVPGRPAGAGSAGARPWSLAARGAPVRRYGQRPRHAGLPLAHDRPGGRHRSVPPGRRHVGIAADTLVVVDPSAVAGGPGTLLALLLVVLARVSRPTGERRRPASRPRSGPAPVSAPRP